MSAYLDDIIDFRQFFSKIIRNWLFFLMSFILVFSIAFAYIRYSKELYKVEMSMLIKDDSSINNPSNMLYDKIVSNKMSVENITLMLKSYPLVFKTLDDLDYDVEYLTAGNIKVSETFNAPIKINCNSSKLIGRSIEIYILDKNKFLLKDTESLEESILRFNQKFNFYNEDIIIQLNNSYKLDEGMDFPKTIIRFKGFKYLTNSYQKRIHITQNDKKSTVVNISMLCEDQQKGVVFLNKLTQNFIEAEIDEKNIASVNTVDFINLQLQQMSDSLSVIEKKIEEFKNNNQITDLSLKAQNIYNNIISVEQELAKSKSLNNYYTYLIKYLEENNEELDSVSVPTSFGIDDAGLNNLIKQLVEIQIKKNILIDGGQINNPAIDKYHRETKQLLLNLKENIYTSKHANDLIIKEFEDRIMKMELSLGDIPEVERELMSIERIQSISENIYIFLLKKRQEAMISTSTNSSDIKVLEPAIYMKKKPVTPDRKKTYLIALLLAILLPLFFMLITELIYDHISTKIDVERLTDIPIISMIGKNYSGHTLLVDQNPKSTISEGFRILKSNLDFEVKNNNYKVYLVTSSVSGEGKTYIAENLGIVFANSGKRTLIIGTDLRKPKLYSDFNISNDQGISNYIVDDIALSDVIVRTEIKHLDILPSGPVPKNPADILSNDKFVNMMQQLREQYDAIIMDTPPLGLVADALTLINYSDINLYIVRQHYTKKGLLAYVNDMYKQDRLGRSYIVFNDLKEGTGIYGYGYGYGYDHNSDYFDETSRNKTE